MSKQIVSLEEVLNKVSERGCKGKHYNNLAVTDNMVEKICQVKSLVNIGFNNTDITDKSLQYLATLPKLSNLYLEDNSQLTGTGFTHFLSHQALRHLDISGSNINDESLKIIIQIPKLHSIRMVNTQITFGGLMAVVNCHRINFIVGDSFSDEQIAQFQQAQRESNKKSPKPVNSDDLAQAQIVLTNFFKAYSGWELFATSVEDDEQVFQKISPKLKKIYKNYITDSTPFSCQGFAHTELVNGKYVGATFGDVTFVDSEFVSKNKMNIYAMINKILKQQYRILMIKQGDDWKIDKIQWHHDGKWRKTYEI